MASCVDTVIVGNGPAALVLSYILSGHVPLYRGGHADALLDAKLSAHPSLLRLTPDLYAHFLSSLRYSTQALPVNTLLDTLLRPNADTDLSPASCIQWRHEPAAAVAHVAVGASPIGGQWAESPVTASSHIETLSYAEQLSLPGYTYADHLASTRGDTDPAQVDFVRPRRQDVAAYLAAYPKAVGIQDFVLEGQRAEDIQRTPHGFFIGSLGLQCKHLVLASGIFTVNIPPTPLLAPIAQLDSRDEPLLVIGSGFSAADAIISALPTRKIIHIYKWEPDTRPSPLRGCHHTAYPEYATVYRQMKLSAVQASRKRALARSPMTRRKSSSSFAQRDWTLYEGLPNAEVLAVDTCGAGGAANVTIRSQSGETIVRRVGGLDYVVGRRGSLQFLSASLQSEIFKPQSSPRLISGRSLRAKAESSLEIARDVFAIGSLAGDSLIRHAVGGCVFAAGRIMGYIPPTYDVLPPPMSTVMTTMVADGPSDQTSHSSFPSDNNSATSSPTPPPEAESRPESGRAVANGHADLHLDRRKMAKAVEFAAAENAVWVNSGWWAGGLGFRRREEG